MFVTIANLLDAQQLADINTRLDLCPFVDGRTTAGWSARLVKNNQQAAPDQHLAELRERVTNLIARNEVFALAARPKRFSPLIFARYADGNAYGSHVDDAMMGGMRTDVAFTLFLSEPDSYDGGELIIETAGGEDAIKLPAGSLFAYPATTLHRVAPVTSGTRQVCVGWVRSLVRSPEQRELLFDLDTARRMLFSRDGKSVEFDLLSKCTANLLRQWVED